MSFERLSATHGSVPLLSIPTVVLDTETTGLDPATDRVVQVGAVRLKGNQIDRHDTFDVLINPQVPIPASSTAIHGIGEQDVVAAADFTAALTKFAAWTGPALVVGYAIGFDLSVLRAEHARNGTTWQGPRSLDVRDLIQVIAPDLPQASLEVAA
ncbi:MAG: 3'-5' exonuclease, partial [Hyphomicrobiaceae bacterium]